jgi:hypothetical protein
MATNCRGNPPWLPILRAATGGRPYNILFGSGLSGLGNREQLIAKQDAREFKIAKTHGVREYRQMLYAQCPLPSGFVYDLNQVFNFHGRVFLPQLIL